MWQYPPPPPPGWGLSVRGALSSPAWGIATRGVSETLGSLSLERSEFWDRHPEGHQWVGSVLLPPVLSRPLLYVRILRGAQRRNKCKAARLNPLTIPPTRPVSPNVCVCIYIYTKILVLAVPQGWWGLSSRIRD